MTNPQNILARIITEKFGKKDAEKYLQKALNQGFDIDNLQRI